MKRCRGRVVGDQSHWTSLTTGHCSLTLNFHGSRDQIRTDGWRGIIADDFTFDNVRRVAGAIASYY